MPIEIFSGSPTPLGANYSKNGVNFALYIENCKKPVYLILYSAETQDLILKVRITQFSGQIGHILLTGLPNSFIYSYLIEKQELLDPFAKCLITPHEWENKSPYQPRAYFINDKDFDWGSEERPAIKNEDLIIYEMHVRGFTQDPSSHVKFPGTYLGIIEKIDHLKSLGINAVELLPINEFNPYEYPKSTSPYFGKIMQYWGYSPVSYFAPMNRYAAGKEYNAAILEFKQMVRALHEAGIEVILDVVYNHTAEGGIEGPTFNFKELGKETYYILDENGHYANFSGCGNTFNCNHPVTVDLILASLRYWVTEMHVDAFRFDLASIFYRGIEGSPPIIEFITKDPILRNIKLIAEPWDAVGLQHSGSFKPMSRWAEWNAYYRDSVRRFIIGTPGSQNEFATRLSGSEDLYSNEHPQKSINFITCHDGFSLKDLVSYHSKHNLANGEENRDGMDQNLSWNCGAEGPSDDPSINELRLRQMKNFHLALIISQGIPMIHMGDEYGHTKKGNNNTWCQDNSLNWFQWKKLEKNKEFYKFYSGLIHFRKDSPLLKQTRFLSDAAIEWHGKVPFEPNWESNNTFIAFTLKDPMGQDLYVAFNARNEPATVHFPTNQSWIWIANSSETLAEKQPVPSTYEMLPYSSLLLQSAIA